MTLTCEACAKGWTCIQIVRNPLARSVSSYIHVMKYNIKDHMIKQDDAFPKDASYRQYIEYLMKFRTDVNLMPKDGGHAGPQYYVCGGESKVFYLPLEYLDDALDAVGQITGYYLGKNKTFTSPHYIGHITDADHPPVYDVPFSQLTKRNNSNVPAKFPPYEDFLQDNVLKRMILTCLFDDDVRFYQRVCGQPWLLDLCPTCSQGCLDQLATMRLPQTDRSF